MGTYYYLLDDTKKQRLHFDSWVKSCPIKQNEIVQMAMINYMFEHQGDNFRLVNDSESKYDEMYDYEEIDLNKYSFADEDINEIINKLKKDLG